MKLYVLSDLHLEFGVFVPPPTDADVVILAGDTDLGTRGVVWAVRTFPDIPVLYIPGNHEFYGGTLQKVVRRLRQVAEGTTVHVLDHDAVVIGETEFLGCTLWTDFRLFGAPVMAAQAAEERMSDYRRIRTEPKYRRLRAHDTILLHLHARLWLQESTAKPRAARRVVITHHAPSLRSVSEERKNNLLSAAYASHADGLVERSGADLWVHGHTHHPVEYAIGGTRVLSNPRGYIDEPLAGFRPGCTVNI